MAGHPNATAIREACEAFNKADMDSAFAKWADDIVWHEKTGRWARAGDYVGKQAVAGFFGAMTTHGLTAMRVEPHDILGSDDHVVALVNLHMERGERKLDNNEVHVWHVKDGKATEVWLISVDPDIEDAFWAA